MVVEGSGQPGARVALAVDIGGTKLAVGVVDEDARVLWSTQRPTPGADGEHMYRTVREMLDEALAAAPCDPVVCGVGCGGPMERGGRTVSPLNITGWRSFPLLERLEGDLGFHVAIDNDAKALALAERWAGAGRAADNFLAMVVSTGVGGGLFVDGRMLDGRLGNAGHVGHVIVAPDGEICPCGARGCLEAEISGTSIARRLGNDPASAPLEEKQRAGRLLGRGVASVASLLDLDLILVGGSVALGFGDPFFAAANAELAARARLDFSSAAVVRPVGLGGEAPIVGAAAVGWRAVETSPVSS